MGQAVNVPARAMHYARIVVGMLALALALFSVVLGVSQCQLQGMMEKLPGVRYERLVLSSPSRAVAHVVRVDLRQPRLQVFASRPSRASGSYFRAQTTEAFLREQDLDLAVNGSFFYPCFEHNPWDYFPHSGDVVRLAGSPLVPAWLPRGSDAGVDPALFVGGPARAQLFSSLPGAHRVPGRAILVRGGLTRTSFADHVDRADDLYPRTAVGLDRSGRTLVLLIVEGKLWPYSGGMTLAHTARLLKRLGAEDALELDGGGSSTLVARDEQGVVRVVNVPVHTRVPGRQRPLASHLGFRMRR